MKKLFSVLLLVFMSLIGLAQPTNPPQFLTYNGPLDNVYFPAWILNTTTGTWQQRKILATHIGIDTVYTSNDSVYYVQGSVVRYAGSISGGGGGDLSDYLLKADSTLYSTKAGRMKSIDSLASVMNTAIALRLLKSDTASMLSPYLRSATAAATYQVILVSGTNIKTINGNTILGSGNISISSGGGSGVDNDADSLGSQPGPYYLSRTNHTGTQLASTISNFQATVSLNTDVAANTAARHTHANSAALALVSGTNTGDQDLTPYLLKADSTLYSTKAGRMKSIDSLAAVMNTADGLRLLKSDSTIYSTKAYVKKVVDSLNAVGWDDGGDNTINLTTTGTNGPSTWNSGTRVLNVPQYALTYPYTLKKYLTGYGTFGTFHVDSIQGFADAVAAQISDTMAATEVYFDDTHFYGQGTFGDPYKVKWHWPGDSTATGSGTSGGTPAKRVVTLTDAATVTLNAATTDQGNLTTLSQTTTFANPSGTPTDGQQIEVRIKSSTSRAVSFGNQFRGSNSIALPTETTGSSLTDRWLFEWNAADSKWDLLSIVLGH